MRSTRHLITRWRPGLTLLQNVPRSRAHAWGREERGVWGVDVVVTGRAGAAATNQPTRHMTAPRRAQGAAAEGLNKASLGCSRTSRSSAASGTPTATPTPAQAPVHTPVPPSTHHRQLGLQPDVLKLRRRQPVLLRPARVAYEVEVVPQARVHAALACARVQEWGVGPYSMRVLMLGLLLQRRQGRHAEKRWQPKLLLRRTQSQAPGRRAKPPSRPHVLAVLVHVSAACPCLRLPTHPSFSGSALHPAFPPHTHFRAAPPTRLHVLAVLVHVSAARLRQDDVIPKVDDAHQLVVGHLLQGARASGWVITGVVEQGPLPG